MTLFGIYQLNMASENKKTTNMKFLDLIEASNVYDSIG
jgi:hypothetical protein